MNDWFFAWLDRHMDRHPRDDWPRTDNDHGLNFYGSWRSEMVRRGIREEEADAASQALMVHPPDHYGQHPGAVIRIVEALWADMKAKGQANPIDTRDEALAASKDCPDCKGMGLAIRWRRLSANPDKPPTIECYCLCPYGRWMEKTHRQSAPDIRKRIHDLADHPWLMDEKYRHDPVLDIDSNLDHPHPPCESCGSVLFRIIRESKWHPWEFQCKTCYGPWEKEADMVFFNVATGKPDLPQRIGSGPMLGNMLKNIARRAEEWR